MIIVEIYLKFIVKNLLILLKLVEYFKIFLELKG